MSYSLGFEAESFEMESVPRKRGCGCAKCSGKSGSGVCRACAQREEEQEAESGLGGIAGTVARAAKTAGAVAAGVLSGKAPLIVDLTAKADKGNRKGTRDVKKVYALVLHQMACCASRKDPLNSYLKINSHFSILRDGRILQMHPVSALLWASNGFNDRSVAVEFAGNFPNARGTWWQGETYGKNQVTPAQVTAGRYLIQYLARTMALTHVLAHRQSSGTRENDPGPDLWFNVGQWAIDTLGMKDGGPGFKIGTGNAIPEEWRKWNKPLVAQELAFQGESALPETELAHDEMSDEGDFESDHEEGELPRGRSMSSRPARKPPTRSSSGSGQQRKGPSRFPARRPRLPLRGGVLASNTAPCVCPQHGSEFVRWLQSSLNQVQGLRLPVNGLIDAATRSAIRSFQEQQALPVDGIAGPETKRALIEAKSGGAKGADGDAASTDAAPTENEMLEFEDTEWEGEVNRGSNEYIKWLQAALNRVIGAQLTVDGISGTYTRSAVRSFQGKQGLAADGIVGPLTEEALIRAGGGTPPGYGGPSTSPSPPTTSPGNSPSLKPSFITIRSGVQLNPAIETAVRGLDAHFSKANLRVTLTSGVRSPESQLSIIRSEAIKRGIDKKYPSISTATVDDIESWRGAWDELLNREGFIVNPPKTTTSRITGRSYSPSPHIAGTAMDLSGADLDRIADVVRGYCREGGSVSQILIERNNNAVHVGVASRGSCAIT